MSPQPLTFTIKRVATVDQLVCNRDNSGGKCLLAQMVLDENLENVLAHIIVTSGYEYVGMGRGGGTRVLGCIQVHSSNDAFYHRQIVTSHLTQLLPSGRRPEDMVRNANMRSVSRWGAMNGSPLWPCLQDL